MLKEHPFRFKFCYALGALYNRRTAPLSKQTNDEPPKIKLSPKYVCVFVLFGLTIQALKLSVRPLVINKVFTTRV